ncbi:potassium channel family protein, partial [Streptomyces galilaeus]|uniref:potassium channel family protein n=1 Tax=Streptomyces galilaeus TaxID=33899 RepID=UPI0038F60BE9
MTHRPEASRATCTRAATGTRGRNVRLVGGSFSEAISRTDVLYFTMTVFSTVGFGDISPRSETARLLVTGQVTASLLLIAACSWSPRSKRDARRRARRASRPARRTDERS